MKKLLLLIFLFINLLSEAQQYLPVIEWQKTIGGSNNDDLYSMNQTNDGGYILGGSSASFISGDKTQDTRGFGDYWVVKINATGSLQWQKTIGGSNADELRTVQQTSDGGYIVGGYSSSDISGEKTSNSVSGDYWVVKLNDTGRIIWQKRIGGANPDKLIGLLKTNDGGYILAGSSNSNMGYDKSENSRGGYDYWLVKINASGIIEWQKTIGGNGDDNLSSIQPTSDSGYILAGYSTSNISGEKTEDSRGGYDYWVVKINAIGIIKWQKTVGGSGHDYLYDVKQTSDGGYALGGWSPSVISSDKTENSRGYDDYWVVKLNDTGVIQWQKTIGGNGYDYLYTLQRSNDGGCILGGRSSSSISGEKTEKNIGNPDFWIIKINTDGAIQWQKTIGGFGYDYLYTINVINDSNYILGGWSTSNISGNKAEDSRGNNDYWILNLKLTSSPDSILGKVFQPQNTNCIQEPNEKGIPNIILKTEPKIFYGISDTTGKYTILTDTGTYKIKQITPAILKPFLNGGLVCPTIGHHTVSFSQYGQDTSEINFANYEKQCAYLQVELMQDRMRRCFDNTTAIKYCNIGNIDTTNVQVIVTLPEYVTFVSASNPNYTINGKKITFNIGNLRANECGIINLITKVDCVNGITGLTQCMEAYILPRNKCVEQLQPDYNLWDRSDITVTGRCTGSANRFVIKNIGQNMADSSTYRIYKDAVLAFTKRFKLLAGDSIVINVSATGHTYRLEADQAAYYPSLSSPNATVENCGGGAASRNFVNQMPQDMADQHVEKVCLPIRDSYDPNDKQVSPTGVGAGKLVKHKVPLDFLIRFQNTGTDTAYKVVITDTLDKNLDLATLEFGASSHLYKVEFTGSGQPILKFTFDKINLVDSFTNEPKSHGFVSFKITPYDSIPNGTLVKNNADIYFDFNLPIRTNTTQVSIDDRLPTGATLSIITSVKEQKNYEPIFVYPNPFNTSTNFEFVYNTRAMQLLVYDIKGELVADENVAGKTTYQLQRNNLPNGMYFYNIQNNEGEIIGRGKLVLQ